MNTPATPFVPQTGGVPGSDEEADKPASEARDAARTSGESVPLGDPVGELRKSWREDAEPLTSEEAAAWRSRVRSMSAAQVLWLQVLVGLLTAAVAGLWSRDWITLWSAGYGAVVVVVPGALLAWTLRARPAAVSSAQRAVSFLVGELAKIGLAVLLLVLAPLLIDGLNWLALLAGMVLCMKVYGLALVWRRR